MSKSILITGASSGIGYALARYYSKQGARVIGLSRHEPKEPYDWDHRRADLADDAQIYAVAQAIEAEYGQLDVLINNAGYGIADALEYTDPAAMRNMFEVNVFGAFILTKACLGMLRRSENPKVIHIGSVAGEIPIPFQAVYAMCKAALHTMSDAWRLELKPLGIDMSVVLPGDTQTGFTDHRQSTAKEDKQYGDRVTRSIAKMARDEQRGMPVKAVVRTVNRQLKRRRMKARVTVGLSYKVLVLLFNILPRRFSLWLVYRLYGS